MKYYFSVLIFTLSFSMYSAQHFQLPKNCTIVETVYGDLDRDGKDEKVIVCNLNQTKDPKKNYSRVLYILKQDNSNQYQLFKKNTNILWGSKECGFCFEETSDPLVSISIKNNTLIIEQETHNNSRRTESYKQIFRYQSNDWYLIGSKYRYWDTCDFDYTYDINFSTQKINITKDTGSCDDIEDPKKNVSSFETYTYKFPKVTMDNYKATEIKFKPKLYFYY
ncbi:hypothetical protein [Elizabethkingia ursingii]|uniref:Uncharacterized protein n=1 Tax=Elizabethkingia ursingii TaxID=1756150 RepID=A0AAJ3NC60_9FLAO|nr:hypothetical protein [Elizabethkingia ursingii]AQX09577.1 hypothetical protein BBD34_13395 [Elizabethkingia ursingii]OPB75309.1 hypothetical protein BAY32_07150 [Elizabethkingia ursingii]OPB93026.1 hypothetical protein BB021_01120 [Elizabethkingia ursingii]